ncbi:aldehyde dehydrogenase [Sphingomonas sp. C8-2]|jgi:acyl-CoA reductase-like NAD-dependent aldehyde dehydrogenase|nr:aldehyde dehydrogenase [Sphingomonas sp. C8-2]
MSANSHPVALPPLPQQDALFIGGEWSRSASGGQIVVSSPATEQEVGRVASASCEDVDRAVHMARQAFDHGPWPRMSVAERVAKLRALAAKVRDHADEFALAWTLQVGVPYADAVYMANAYASFIETPAELAERHGFEELRQPPLPEVCMIVREPVGVVAAIVPWNAPMLTLLVKVAPALAAGCTVIAKPSPETPYEALLLAQCIAEIGLPEGVFSVLPADRDVSEHLVSHPDVDKVSFTGSTAAGLKIAAICGARMARVTTELGGKSAAVVLADAKIETVVAGIMPNLVGLAGQQCAAFSRILVPGNRRAEVTDAIAAAMRAVRVGDPFDPATTMGPLVARRQLDRVCGLIAGAHRDGARLVTGGGRPPGLDRGHFIEPTLFTDVDNGMEIARQEIFGPVGSIIAYDSEEEAIAIANDSHYGLSGAVFTEDVDRAYRFARRIRVGNFTQNKRIVDFSMPYGGFKQSGIGREGGLEGLYGFTEIKAVFLPEKPSLQ